MNQLSCFIILFAFFNNTNAQVHLQRSRLKELCNYDSFTSTKISLKFKNITTIDPDTFQGLNSLQNLDLSYNQLEPKFRQLEPIEK